MRRVGPQLGGRWRTVVVCAAVAWCAAMAGCQSEPARRDAEVTIQELMERHAPTTLNTQVAAPITPKKLRVQRLVFEADDPRVALAMEMLETPAVDAARLERWRANGLRIGSIERERLAIFLANLPKLDNGEVDLFTLHNVGVYNPIVLVSRLRGVQKVRIVEGDGAERTRRFLGGRYQLLLKLMPAGFELDGPLTLTVAPHHYGQSASLTPRDPREAALDGTVFDELALRFPLDDGRVYVVWADGATPREKDGDEASEGAGDAPDGEGGLEDDGQFEPTGGRAVVPLGEAMFHGRRGRRAAQFVLIFATEAPPSPDSAQP